MGRVRVVLADGLQQGASQSEDEGYRGTGFMVAVAAVMKELRIDI